MANTLEIRTTLVGLDNNVEVLVDGNFGAELEPVQAGFTFEALPKASQEHIIRVGITNILRDSMAGKASDPVEARQALVDKFGRVKSGDVSGAARGPRLSPEERCRTDYLNEVLAKHCKSKGVAMPKGKEALQAARDKVYANNTAKVDAEVKRRLKAATAAEIEIEL